MKLLCLVLTLVPLGLIGCDAGAHPPMDAAILPTAMQQEAADTWYTETGLKGDVTAGILSQRTLYPYHFDAGAARLTPLGQRDVGILADYYKTAPNTLTIVRGDASNELYAARTSAVRDALQKAGVDVATVTIGDGYPGGRGMSGQAVVDSIRNDKGQFSGSSSDTGSITSQGLTTGSDTMNKGSGQ